VFNDYVCTIFESEAKLSLFFFYVNAVEFK
jgi:hypothetical protein